MKRILLVINLFVIMVVSLSAEITKNEFNTGLDVTTNEAKEKTISLPYLTHAFELETGSVIFGLESETILEFDNGWNRSISLAIIPSIEYGFTEVLFTKVGLSGTNTDFSATETTIELETGYSTLAEDIEQLSPWATFEEGFNASTVYTQTEEDRENEIALNLDYAYLNKELNLMIKPSVVFTKIIAKNSDIEPNFLLQFAKDFSCKFTICADASINSGSSFESEIKFLYFPIKKLEMSVSLSYLADDYYLGFGMDLLIFE